jgi:hypothetical protein
MRFTREKDEGREGQEHFTGDEELARPALARRPGNPGGSA